MNNDVETIIPDLIKIATWNLKTLSEARKINYTLKEMENAHRYIERKRNALAKLKKFIHQRSQSIVFGK